MERFPGEFPPDVVSPDDIPAEAGSWERWVRLDHARQWLELKIDDLRRSCREMAESLNGQSPLTPADVAALAAAPPHRSMYDISAEFRRLGERTRGPLPPAAPEAELDARANALAAAVERLRGERAELRRMFLALTDVIMPEEPLTDEELYDMLHGPRGQPIREFIAELERELGGPL